MTSKPLGFTRIELLATAAALGLLSLVVAPVLARGTGGSERAVCWNNLRNIGRAVQTWAGDHDDQPPWWTPIPDLGTYTTPGYAVKPAVAWFEFAYLSNYIGAPSVVTCPADRIARIMPNWGEFIFANGRTKAVSYNLGLHSVADSPKAWVCSDLNLATDVSFTTCEARVSGADGILMNASSSLGWTNGVSHGNHGHLLLNDGAVEFTSTARLRDLVLDPYADRVGQGTNHLMHAR